MGLSRKIIIKGVTYVHIAEYSVTVIVLMKMIKSHLFKILIVEN